MVDWRFWHDWFHDTVMAGSFNWLSTRWLAEYVDQRGHRRLRQRPGALVTQGSPAACARIQTGYVRNYALSVLLGVVFIVGYLLFVSCEAAAGSDA